MTAPLDALAAADTLRRIMSALPARSARAHRLNLALAAAADRLEDRVAAELEPALDPMEALSPTTLT